MSDLIRREEVARAVRLLSEVFIDGGSPTAAVVLNIAMDHINALPAVQSDDDLVGHMTKLIAVGLDRIEQLTAERDRLGRELNVAKYGQPDFAWSVHLAAMAEVQAERDRLREAIDYILDGMGIADPDYDIDPDDDFLDAANSEWVRDTLTRLAAALKGETP